MRRRWIVLPLIGSLGAVVASIVATGWATPGENRPVETLLPADSVLYVSWVGTEHQKEAWEKTAACESLEKSGLVAGLTKLALSSRASTGNTGAAAIKDLLESIARNGFSLSLSIPKKTAAPLVVLVLRDAARLEPLVGGRLPALFGELEKFEAVDVRGRHVTRTRSLRYDNLEIAWWAEGGHLIAVVGKEAVTAELDLAEGKSPPITTSANWRKDRQDRSDFDPAFCGWLDVALLKARLATGSATDRSATRLDTGMDQLLKNLGLDRTGSIVCRYGFEDRALVSGIFVDAPRPRTGLLSLMDQGAISLADLPPLPHGTTTLLASSFDCGKCADVLTELARTVGDLVAVNGSSKIDNFLKSLPEKLGGELKRELVATLGRVMCLYNDASDADLGKYGLGLAIRVKDANRLNKFLGKVSRRLLPNQPYAITVDVEERLGRRIYILHPNFLPIAPVLCIDKHWLFVGMSLQSVEDALERIEGKSAAWIPSLDQERALKAVPSKFQMLSLTDPRATIATLVACVQYAVLFGDSEARRQGPDPRRVEQVLNWQSSLDVVTRPLFPNVCAWTVDDAGLHGRARESAPGLWGVGDATLAVMASLMTAANSNSFDRERSTQANLSEILIALRNFHYAHQSFPAGTHPNKQLKPEQRLSWMADILPFVDSHQYRPLHSDIDFSEAWDSTANRGAARVSLFGDGLVSAGNPNSWAAATHCVGFAGLGVEGPTLPVTSPKAGCFAYDRVTRMRDITDGLSCTAMLAGVSKDVAPWAAGGRSTIRALTARPYINGPDGIGGPDGATIGMADGSVRTLSNKVDPKVFEALVTIHGGETVDWSRIQRGR
jgi:uncharacterized protein DUF1559